ncbi:MAG: hypothetical protein ACRCZF_20405 [Gemmataceae bacterium]
MRRLRKIALTFVPFAGLLGLAVWVAGSMSYVPTAEQVQAREDFRSFLVEPYNVEGVYANMDVDSAVFRYTTTADEAAFWRRVEEQAVAAGWAVVAPEGAVMRFQRVIPPVGEQVSWWVEELRVRYRPSDRRVVVGWVQADPRQAVAGLAECFEAEFAERAIWPHLRTE